MPEMLFFGKSFRQYVRHHVRSAYIFEANKAIGSSIPNDMEANVDVFRSTGYSIVGLICCGYGTLIVAVEDIGPPFSRNTKPEVERRLFKSAAK